MPRNRTLRVNDDVDDDDVGEGETEAPLVSPDHPTTSSSSSSISTTASVAAVKCPPTSASSLVSSLIEDPFANIDTFAFVCLYNGTHPVDQVGNIVGRCKDAAFTTSIM